MSHPKSLTVSSLITLVGEDKLYATLESTLYQTVTTFDRTISPKIFNFRTSHNPIEWLLFNNKNFLLLIMDSSLCHSHTNRFIISILRYVQKSKIGEVWTEDDENTDCDIFYKARKLVEAKKLVQNSIECPTELAEAAWMDICEISCKEFYNMMADTENYTYIYQFKEGDQEDFLVTNANVLIKNLGQ